MKAKRAKPRMNPTIIHMIPLIIDQAKYANAHKTNTETMLEIIVEK